MSNVASQVRLLKIKGMKMLRMAMDAKTIAEKLNVSLKLVQEWEEEYVKDILSQGQGQRVRMRAMIMRQMPQTLMKLNSMAMQDIEPRMALSAAQTIMRFGMAFLHEDTLLTTLEENARESAGAVLMHRTLFDFADEDVKKSTERKPSGRIIGVSNEKDAEDESTPNEDGTQAEGEESLGGTDEHDEGEQQGDDGETKNPPLVNGLF